MSTEELEEKLAAQGMDADAIAERAELSEMASRVMGVVDLAFGGRMGERTMILVLGDSRIGLEIQVVSPHEGYEQAVETVKILGRALRYVAYQGAGEDAERRTHMLGVVQEAVAGGPRRESDG